MEKVYFKSKNGQDITIAAVIHFPEGFDKGKKYRAVIVSHPGGGVKEQTAGLYARKLAEQRLVTIAFDRSYQGESTGEPRQLENPYISTEDVSAVVDYLTTLPYIDPDRIGGMGICAGGGYTATAAINDHRLKAIGTVSAVNIGSMFRNGWDNDIKSKDAIPALEGGSNARTAGCKRFRVCHHAIGSSSKGGCPQQGTGRGLGVLPLQIVAGSVVGSKWMSDGLYSRAASKDKKFHVVEGANHMDLYDVPKYVDETVSVLAPFFKSKL
jgi:fermentation-respiration switch protein FrsA (DUF1100 family)